MKGNVKHVTFKLKIILFYSFKGDDTAAAAVSDSVRPHRWQPTRLPHPWDSPGKNTGMGCHFLQCMRVRLLATPWTAAYQAPPSMGFSRQEYWSGVPLPSLAMTLVRDKRPKCWPMVGSKAFWLNKH